jgi:hypothetical protein
MADEPGSTRISLAAVTEAIIAVMRASSPQGTADAALAARIGVTIQPQLAQVLRGAIVSGADLAGQQAFRTMLAQHLSTTTGMDEQTRRALLHTLNRTGAEFAALIAPFLRGGGLAGRFASLVRGDTDERSDAVSSTSSFYSDDAFLRSPPGRAMQRFAHEQGLEWAVNRADVLRLGEDAVRLFARTHFRHESFAGLRSVGMQARDIERLVRRAEESGQDANVVARTVQDSLRVLGTTPERRQELLDAMNAFHANPNDNAAWERLSGITRRHETSPDSTAEQQDQARKLREAEEKVRQAATQHALTAATETTVTTTHITARQETSAVVDDLNGPAPPSTPRPPPTSPPPTPEGPR